MRTGRSLASLIVVLAITGGSGCSSTTTPPDHFYRLDVAPATDGGIEPAGCYDGTILVERFGAAGILQGRAVLYVEATSPLEIGRHHYHFWTEPPSDMLTAEMVTFLRSQHVGGQVVPPGPDLEYNYAVQGRVRRFERRVNNGRQNAAVEFELAMVDASSGRVLVSGNYRSEGPPAGPSVADGIPGFSTAAADAFRAFASDLSRSCAH